MTALTQPTTRLRDHRPEPSNLWIRHSAVLPPPSGLLWVDVVRRDLGGGERYRQGLGRQFEPPEDLLYLPPSEDEAARRLFADWCRQEEVPTLVHCVVGDDEATAFSGLATVVLDPLSVLLEDRLELLESVPAEGLVVWPVLAGLTDGAELLEAAIGRLSKAGVVAVVPMALELSPAAGRRLTETYGDRLFASVFHSGEVDLRPIARVCRRQGVDFLPPRPALPRAPVFERQLATELSLIGDLWVASGKSPARAQEYFRAAAWVQENRYDVTALVRDGNLGIVPALTDSVVEIVEELSSGQARSTLLMNLQDRFTAAPRAT